MHFGLAAMSGVAQRPSAVKALCGLGMEIKATELGGEEMGSLVVYLNRNIMSKKQSATGL